MSRRLLVLAAGGLILAVVVVLVVLAWASPGKEPTANPALPPATAAVTRTTLVETKTVAGTLGYGDPVPVNAASTGTLTWIAPVGSTVKRGEPLFKEDQRPVIVLYGSLPLYRPLRDGVRGADVRELERNLSDLGYGGLTVDATYSSATAAAVRSFQADVGMARTGTVEPSQALLTPGPVRIAAHAARVGDALGGEQGQGGTPVLSYTGTTRRVTVQLGVADRHLAARGRAVTVKVPGRRAVKGRISRVGSVVAAPVASSETGAAPDQGTSSAGASPATFEVTVAIANQRGLGWLDAAPTDVDFVSSKREDVLAVPVAALLALPTGGFGVEVVNGDTTRIVAVKTGMFAAGLVEVSGQGIAEGVKVGVPK
jgi:peptidoglycan hydrolase-like protein with peptidoglycan-binding domain